MDFQWFKNIVNELKVSIDNKNTEIGTQIINQGMSPTEVYDLVNNIVEDKLKVYTSEAKQIFDHRTEDFKKQLLDELKELQPDEIIKLREPDTQFALREAVSISGRKHDKDLTNLLARLVISRIKNDKSGKEELKNIVYNEAISTINRLTIDQLKIITLCYLIRFTFYPEVNSWESLNDILESNMKPFLDFKNTESEFQHIEYSGCGSLKTGVWKIFDILKNQYTNIFFNLIDSQQIKDLNITEELKKELFELHSNKNKYSFKAKSKELLKKDLDRIGIEEEDERSRHLRNLYNSQIMSNTEVKILFERKISIGSKLVDIWENSSMRHLSLTTVGIAIAISYFEQLVGEKLDVDIWIY